MTIPGLSVDGHCFYKTMIMENTIIATPAARELIRELKEKHGDLMFYMSGGCCEGSQPMCFKKGEYLPGVRDVLKGTVEGAEFYLSQEQHEYYQHSRLILDAQDGMGGGFSLEGPLGKAFSVSSELIEAPSQEGSSVS